MIDQEEEAQEPSTGEARALDEEIAGYQKRSVSFDARRHRRRNQILAGIALGALGAGLVYVVMTAFDQARNPCQRVRDHFCGQDAKSAACASYESILKESVEDGSPAARGAIRYQCETRITRLREDEGVHVR
jgi:hypothetical protein